MQNIIQRGVDAQNLLVNGSAVEVAAKVRELYEIFPAGLIISPSHEAILADIPPANIDALFKVIYETTIDTRRQAKCSISKNGKGDR